jgi:phosphomannomutase/phosphoglucomutase
MNNPFKSYDVRGVFNKELMAEDVIRIGLCHADLVKQTVVIGSDVRTSSPIIKSAFISGYLSAGYDIIDIGVLPTPVINFYGMKHNYDTVTITGSHTSPENNGIKFFDKLGVIYNKRLRKIEEKYLNNDFKRVNWDEIGNLVIKKDCIKEYINNIKSKIKIKNKIKIVLDHGNGTTGIIAPLLFKELDCEIVNISEEPNGSFPNRKPEPKRNNLAFLQKRVVETKSDFGCAFDGDGDRSVFVDDKGRVLDGSRMNCFFAREILKKNKDAFIVASVDTSSALKTVVEENEGNLVWCAVGMKNIEHGLIENKAMFGGEVSSHFYFNDFYPFSDGILSCAKLAEIMSKKNKNFSELLDKLPVYPIKHAKFSAKSHKIKFKTFEKIKKELSKEYNVDTVDGVKFFLNKTDWVLIRPSNTEPVIRLSVESSNIKDLEENFQKFKKLIKKHL